MMEQSIDTSGQLGTLVWPHPQGVDIVFGLDWTPLVGGVPAKLGRGRARSLRATHYLVIGSLAAVVGCGVIRKGELTGNSKRTEKTIAIHSAAAVFAHSHQSGITAAICFVPKRGYWLVAANAGLVLAQTDRWYESIDEAHAALAVLRARFPSLQVLRPTELNESDLPDWMLNHLTVHSCLQRLSAKGSLYFRLACLSLFIMSVIWFFGGNASEQPLQPPEENASVLWQQVFDRFAQMHPIHQPEQLFRVINAWHQAPLTPGGWKLNQIVCEPAHMDWHCAARYTRFQRLALGEQLDAAKPVGWTVEFPDFEHGVMRWQVAQAASVFEPVAASTPLKSWLSYLQSVAPVFESIQIGTGSPITMSAPVSRQGVLLERPAHIKPLKRRHIAIKGPLRSISALRGLMIPVRWRGLQLELGAPGGQGVSRSGLTVNLTGEIFEIAD